MENVESIIHQQAFLSGLKPEHFEALNHCAAFAHFEPRRVIFQEGEAADRFYIVTSGRVALESAIPGKGVSTIQTIGPGEALGWSWLFPPHRWHFGARAIEPTEAVEFDARRLRAEIEANHDFGYELLRRFAELMLQRLQATRIQMLDIYGGSR